PRSSAWLGPDLSSPRTLRGGRPGAVALMARGRVQDGRSAAGRVVRVRSRRPASPWWLPRVPRGLGSLPGDPRRDALHGGFTARRRPLGAGHGEAGPRGRSAPGCSTTRLAHQTDDVRAVDPAEGVLHGPVEDRPVTG